MRAITRTTGVGINTVAKLLHDAGEAADAYRHEHVRGVRGRRHVQCDEIWAFVDAKECNVRTPRRHRPKSPVVCTGIEKTTVWDTPDMRTANTSHVERRNRTVRMSVRRFTRTLRLDLTWLSQICDTHCPMRPVDFRDSSRRDLRRLPKDVRHDVDMDTVQTHSDVWDAIADTPAEAANLKIRSQLMIALTEYVMRQAITQQDAAKQLGVPRSRVSELINGRISKFSIDKLVNMASRVNLETHIVVKQNGIPLSISSGQ